MQIALLVVLLFAAVYFVALRPKADEPAPVPPAPAAQSPESGSGTGLLARPEQAQKAVEQANKSSQASQDAADAVGEQQSSTGQSQAQPQPQQSPAPNTKAGEDKPKGSGTISDPSLPIVAAAKKGTVQVILFYDAAGSDDRFVRSQLAQVNRHGGKVAVRAVPISKVGDYRAITSVVTIETSPTIVILNRKLEARTIIGYSDAGEINGVVGAIYRRNR